MKKHNHAKVVLLILFTAILVTGFSSCKSKSPEASASAKKYELQGKVVSASKSGHTVTINHEEISGYMQAMTMPFALYEDWVSDELKPGSQIHATLVVDGGKTWLENPIVTSVADPALAGKAEETGVEPDPGSDVPDFSLVNQDGKKISLKQYQGSTLVLTFIYTRCPMPDYCPLMSNNFSKIREDLLTRPELKNKTRLLSITVDPDFDKPSVLREYGLRYAGSDKDAVFKKWEFATGTPEQIKAVAQFFGLNYWPEKGQIIHGLRTAIIAPDGRVFKIYRGNEWKPSEIVEQLGRIK